MNAGCGAQRCEGREDGLTGERGRGRVRGRAPRAPRERWAPGLGSLPADGGGGGVLSALKLSRCTVREEAGRAKEVSGRGLWTAQTSGRGQGFRLTRNHEVEVPSFPPCDLFPQPIITCNKEHFQDLRGERVYWQGPDSAAQYEERSQRSLEIRG